MDTLYPDYKNCVANLACSVLRYFGAQSPDNGTLPMADELLSTEYKNVVILLLDGMGKNILEANLEPDGFFRRNLRGVYSSVFPPTTVAATTSLESGLFPNQHCWLGWECYYKGIDENVTVFLNTRQGTAEPAADFDVAWTYFPYTRVTELVRQAGYGAYHATPFYEPFPEDFDAICGRVSELCALEGKKYIYAYWNEPDHVMHETGAFSESSKRKLTVLQSRAEALAQSLEDTLLIITADHGQIDSDIAVITDYEDICECLVRAPSIEPRALNLFIKEGCGEKLKSAFNRRFGDKFTLFSREEVIENGLFGPGASNPALPDMLGDYLAVATDSLTIFNSPRDIVGVHAGMTAGEMLVPFIAVTR